MIPAWHPLGLWQGVGPRPSGVRSPVAGQTLERDLGRSCRAVVGHYRGWTVVAVVFGGEWSGVRTSWVGRKRGSCLWTSGHLLGGDIGFMPSDGDRMLPLEAVSFLHGGLQDRGLRGRLWALLREASSDEFSDLLEVMAS